MMATRRFKGRVQTEADRREKRRQRHRARTAAAKAVPCYDCGNQFPPVCMDFDHVRGRKRSGVSQMTQLSDEIFYAEVAKCEVVCANCHRIRTCKHLGWKVQT